MFYLLISAIYSLNQTNIVPHFCGFTDIKEQRNYELPNSTNWPLYSFTEFSSTYPELTMYYTVCRQLTEDDIPDEYKSKSNLLPDAWAMICNKTSGYCEEIAYRTDFSYVDLFINGSNTDGFEMYADGIYQYMQNRIDVHGYDIVYIFECSDTSNSTQPVNTEYIEVSSSGYLRHQFYVTWSTGYACGKETHDVHTPLPEFDCEYFDRDDTYPGYAYSLDFGEINNGHYGLRTVFLQGEDTKYVYYTPCGQSFCPSYSMNGSTNCDKNISSFWVCDKDDSNTLTGIGYCVSWGLTPSDYKGVYDSSNGYIYHKIPSDDNNKSVHIKYNCDLFVPETYIEFPPSAEVFSDSTLGFVVESMDACLKPISPTVQNGTCSVNATAMNENGQEWKLELNLSQLHSIENLDVSANYGSKNVSMTLYYSPCNTISCPDHYNCYGDEDAHIYLCNSTLLGAVKSCIGYGLAKYDVTYSYINSDPLNGVMFSYKGDGKYQATMYFVCDESAENMMLSNNTVYVDGEHLHAEISVKDACMSGPTPSPTPIPVLRPSVPSTSDPTIKSYVGPYVFAANESHYVLINLENISEHFSYSGLGTLVYRDYVTVHTYTKFNPWTYVSCPTNATCGSSKANGYTCWSREDGSVYCHNSADKKYGVYLTESLSSSGYLLLHYEGGHGLGMDIRLQCSSDASSEFLWNSLVVYHTANETEFEYSASTSLACGEMFDISKIPDKSSFEETTPKYSSKIYDSSGKSLYISLRKFKSSSKHVLVGRTYPKTYAESSSIFLSPSKTMSCPDGYTCKDGNGKSYDEANLWKCFSDSSSQKRCIPMGYAKKSLSISLVNSSSISYGLNITYGGIDGYSTNLILKCDSSIRRNSYQLESFAQIGSNYKTLNIVALTSNVCTGRAESSGGAIFLMVIIYIPLTFVILGYFYNLILSKKSEFPLSDRIGGLFSYVATGFVYISTLGKKVYTGAHEGYNNI